MVNGYSYGCHTGSLASPLNLRCKVVHENDLLAIVMAEVHPANWRVHPPCPDTVASRGVAMGLATYREFFTVKWF